MDGLPEFFFEADGAVAGRFHPTALTRGPWDNRAQHGGPPCALLARALAAFENPEVEEPLREPADILPPVYHPRRQHPVARIAFSLLRPVPIAPLDVRVEAERLGRAVHRLQATLATSDGKVLIRADALRIRRAPSVEGMVAIAAWRPPEQCTPLVFDFFRHEVGYHRGVQLKTAFGHWGRTPIGVWGRLRAPLVAGASLTALETMVALADAQSGMGVPLDPHRFTFVNPDLSVFLTRDPVPGWVGFDITSTASPHGSGLAQSGLRDAKGLVGRAAQTLVVADRQPG